MAINLASRLSAITTDFAGVNHIVWSEDNAIWHAQYNANAGTWVNAQRLAEGLAESVTALNLVANQKLIGSGSSASPGLAVIWQAGDQKANSSNFYYSAAQYGANGQLQWDATPTALTVNTTAPAEGSGLPFANLAPRVIADNNGNITVVGQQVNVNNAANQTIREDTDLYATAFNIASVSPATTVPLDAVYEPPVLANGVNQAAGIPVSQTANALQVSAASITDDANITAQSTLATASSTSDQGFQGIGFKYGPSLSFSTGLYKALGLDEYIFGIPGGLLRLVMEPYDLVGMMTGSGLAGSELSVISQGVVEKFTGELEEKDDPSRFFEKTKKGASISFAFSSKTSYNNKTPYYLSAIEDVLAISLLDKIPIFDKPAGLWAGRLDFIGSVGLAAVLDLESSGDTTDTLLQLILDDAALNLPSLLLGFISSAQLSGGKNGIAGALIAATVFGPIEDILIGNLTDSANLTISNYLVGPTIGANVEGLLLLAEAIKFTAAAGVDLFFGFGQGGNETTVLRIPLEVGVGLGPIGLSISIEPTWVWPSNPPLTTSGTSVSNAGDLSALVSLTSASSETADAPSATVAGSLLTLAFNAPLDVSNVPGATDFQIHTQASDQSNPVTFEGSIGTISVSNDPTTGNGVVVLQLSQPLVYSPQFAGTNPQTNGEAKVFLSYTGTALEFNDDTQVAQFTDISVINNSPQSLTGVFNPTTGNGQDYTVGNQQALLGSLEADYAQDSPPALTLVSSSSNTEGQVLAVWSREVQPLTPIAGFVNSDVVYLNFVQAVNTTSTPSNSQFTVSLNETDETITVTNVEIEAGGYIKLNLSQAVDSGDSVVISYSPNTNSQTDNLYLTDAVQSQLWLPAFSETLTNTTGQDTTLAPELLGGSVIIDNGGAGNLITLIFNGLLGGNTPNGDQFTVVNNGQAYAVDIGNVAVSGNTVTFNVPAPTASPLLSQGDIVTITYTPGSEINQNLNGLNGTVIAAFTSTALTTLPENPTTSLMAGVYTPGSTASGLSQLQNIPGSDGLNFDPAVAADTSGNALAVWVYANSSNLANLTTPGEFYTDNQTQIIIDALSQSDIYFSYWNGSGWSIASPLAISQPGTDNNVAVAYDAASQSYITAWLNTQQPSGSTGEPTATIYWASYEPASNIWSPVNTVLSEATPDPLTDLVIGAVNGQPAIFWTQTQPISYSQLTTQNNPELYFRLGELEGTNAQNQGDLGSMADGTYNGTFTLEETGALFDSSNNSGDPNPAALFSNGGSMTIESSLLTNGGSAFSVEFWFKIPDAVNAPTNLVDLDGVFSVALSDNNGDTTLTFGLDNTSNSSITTNPTTNPIETDTWYYVVGTYSDQTQGLGLYLNGQPVGTLDNVSLSAPANAAFTIAGGTDAVYLDEVALYGNALSYSTPPPSNSTSSLDLLNTIFNTNLIGEKYAAQYVAPLAPGPQAQVSLLNSGSANWSAQNQVNPLPLFQPTTLSDANSPLVDVVASTTPNITGNIFPNGQQDTIFSTTINGFQGKVIESISLALSNGLTYGVGSNNLDNQLGVVIGNSLINSTQPNTPFYYAVMGSSLTLDLLVDTGSGASNTVTVDTIAIGFTDGTTASNTGTGSSLIDMPRYIPPNSVPITPGVESVLGTATVTEVEDSSLTLIDSGLAFNTTNQAMGYAVASADFNNDGRSDVAVGNRGYTDSSGAIINNGTVQILMGGQAVLSGAGGPLSPPTSADSSAEASGNTGGFAIVGIPDGGQANGDFVMSLATGDVDADSLVDLVIGSPNNSTVYVIYGSYLASTSPETVINVAAFTSNQGYSITSPSGSSSGDLFGFAVTAGNFDTNPGADIAIGAPNAINSMGQVLGGVYVAYDGSNTSSLVYQSTYSTNTDDEQAGYSLATSAYITGSSSTFSGSTSTDDLIIGAPNHSLSVNNTWAGSDGFPVNNPNPYPDSTLVNVGAVYVLTSGSSGLNSAPSFTYYGTDASTPSANGAAQSLFAGSALASGDWNGDKNLDLAIAAPSANENNGAVYILNGNSASASPNAQYLNQVSNLTLNGGLSLGQAGAVVAWAGDVNDDNYEDLLVTAPQGANAIGQGYVVFGASDLLGAAGNTSLTLSPIASDSKSNFLLNGNFPYQLTGQAAAAIGDINDDNVDDLLITAPNANQFYAVYGHPWLADDGSIKLADISGDNGFVTDGDLYTAPGTEPVGPTQAINIGGNQSSLAPALIINSGISYLAYVDASTNLITLITSTDVGDTWTSPATLPSAITTSQSPALTFYQGDLYLAYVGNDNEVNLTYSSNSGQSWSAPYAIGQTSSAGVSLVDYQDQLLAFFVADDPSSRILYAYSSEPQDGGWSTDYVVTYQNGPSISNQTASSAISATVMGETLYLAYRGGTVGSAGNYYVTDTSGSDLANLSWVVSELTEATSANSAPGITNDGSQLYFTYANTSQELVTSVSSNGDDWSAFNTIPDTQAAIAIASNEQPAAAALDGSLYLGLLGNAATADIWFTSTSFDQPFIGTGNQVIMLGDVNGDGFADVFAAGSPYGAILTFGASTRDLLDAATGTEELVINIANFGLIQTVSAAGDFNGDGLADFGVLDQNQNFYLIPGDPSLGPQQSLTLSTSTNTHQSGTTSAVPVGDYNGDGYDDLLLTVNGQQQLYKGNRAGTLSDTVPFAANGNTVFSGVGDINGDGYDDIGGGAPNSNQVSPYSSITNGGGTVYLGNSTASSDVGSTINPPAAAVSAELNNSSWQNFTYDAQQTKFNSSPSFAFFNGYLYMAYTGVSSSGDNGSLYVQRSADGYNWEGLTNFGSGFEASTGFSLAVHQGGLTAAYLDQYGELIFTYADSSDNELGLAFNSNNNFNTGTYPSYVTPVLVNDPWNLYMYYATGGEYQSEIGFWYYDNDTNGPWAQGSTLPAPPNAFLPLGASFAVTTVGTTSYISFATGNGSSTATGLTFGKSDGNPWQYTPISESTVLRGTGLLSIGETLYNFYLPSSGDINVTTSTNQGENWTAPSQIQAVSNQNWLTYPNPIYYQESIFLGYGVQLASNDNVDISYAISNPIYQPNLTQQFGQQLEDIGDFNGDGIADLAVLAPGFFSNTSKWNNQVLENNQGAVLIYYGSTNSVDSSSTPDVVLATPAPTSSTIVANNQAYLLNQMAPAGDVNGDGYDDLIVASPNTALTSNNTTDGIAFLLFGGGESLWGDMYPATQPFNLGNLTSNVSQLTLYFSTPLNTGNLPTASAFAVTNGFNNLIAVQDLSSSDPNELTLNLAGDVNISDSLTVTYTVPTSGTVLSYASGTNVTGFTASNDAVIATLGAPTIEIETYSQYGFSITGLPDSQSGISLDGGGDINGDGFDDFLIGAPGDDDNLAYTLFGSDFNHTVNQTGTIGDDVMVGSPTGESFVAGQGDDLVVTGGGVDVAYAGPGDDQVIVNDLYFQRLDGGTGTDALFFYGSNGQAWDLTTLSPGTRLRNFEVLVTENYGANTLTLNSVSVIQISPTNTITVFMDEADSLDLSSDFSYNELVYQYDQNFSEYLSSATAARVLVNQPNSSSQVTFDASATNNPAPILPTGTNATEAAVAPATTNAGSENPVGLTSIANEDPITTTNAANGLPTLVYVSNPTISEGTGRAEFTLTRTGDLSTYVWFDYYTQDGDAKAGDRYTPIAGEGVFAPGEATVNVTVPIPNNVRNVGNRQFSLAVILEGESANPTDVPDAWKTAITSPNEQIRRWTLIPGEDSSSVTFDVTTSHSTDQIVTLDMDLDGLVIPLVWNPTTLSYDNIPISNTNGIAQSQDISGDLTNDLYRLRFQDGGPFDNDSLVNGLVALNFELAQLTPIPVPATGGVVSGTQSNDYLNAQQSTGTTRLAGLGGMDVLIGSPQRDVLTGGTDNDRLYGKAGVDQLYGEAGDDLLDGGLGMDFLYGGPGADSFVLRAGNGPDRVMDFNAADGDLFLLENLVFGALSFQNNRTFLGTELLATVIDNLGNPVTTLSSNPQWFTAI